MNMADPLGRRTDAVCDMFFFKVGMERIIHAGNRRVVNPREVRTKVCHGVDEIAFKAIDRFEDNFNARGIGIITCLTMKFNATSDFFFRGAGSAEMSQRLVEGAA